jgi:hypothetical protein
MQVTTTTLVSHSQIWIWLVLASIGIGVPAIVIGTAVLLRARAARVTLRQSGQLTGPASAHVRRVTRCGLAGLGVGALIAVTLFADHRPGGLGILAFACGYLGGVLVGEYTAQPPARGLVRAARLLARRPADFVPRWAVGAAALSAVVVLASPIAFAAAPAIHYPGCPRGWQCITSAGEPVPGGQTSWPAWPDMAAAAALVAAAVVVGAAGLRRIAARPGPAGDPGQVADDALRRQAGRAILGAVLGLEMFVLATVLILGSNGLMVPNPVTAPGAYLGGQIMVYAGLGCAGAGLVSWLVLSGWTRRPRPRPPAPGVAQGS